MHILVLGEADDHDPLRIEVTEETRKAKSGTIDADARQRDDPPSRIQHFESEIGRELVEHDGFLGQDVLCHIAHSSCIAISSACATPFSSTEATTLARDKSAASAFATANLPPARSIMGRSLS